MKKLVIVLATALVVVGIGIFAVNEYGRQMQLDCQNTEAEIQSIVDEIGGMLATSKVYEEQLNKLGGDVPVDIREYLTFANSWQPPRLIACVRFVDNTPMLEALTKIRNDRDTIRMGLDRLTAYVDSQYQQLIESAVASWSTLKELIVTHLNWQTLIKLKDTIVSGSQQAKVELYRNPDTRKILDALVAAKDKVLEWGTH